MSGVAVLSLEELVGRVGERTLLAVPPDYSFVAMAATRALIRRGVRDLHLLAVPQSGLQADLLIGAGCVAIYEAAGTSLGELGPAPRFMAALKAGRITMRDSTCPAIHAGLQAAEKGIPFMPLRGIIGSDLLQVRPDWKIVSNPFQPDDAILALPAIKPDFALFHAPFADRRGNVWVGRRRELATLAHAAVKTFVTYEEERDGDMLEDELLAPGVISSIYVSAVALARRGAWPLGVAELYGIDDAHLAQYARAAKTREGFQRYLEEFVCTPEKSSSPASLRA